MKNAAVAVLLCLCLVYVSSQELFSERFAVPKPIGVPVEASQLRSRGSDVYVTPGKYPSRVYGLFKRAADQPAPEFQVKRMYVARIGKRQVYRARVGK
ncbi:unnamed protein product [Bursaphelenchus xylophilus]|uniref:(pine wood nematode) hypothetical protein n=1 Tax=Bursaphelenchus xylophilus TaxID=6326 RepID=A0A1I7SEG0_BURXY|nr:unnamed protein product [Bursaphelenchus xylophilus]CAG9103970.1 unnamed protein product [Bursaphelenchus xylophilus]